MTEEEAVVLLTKAKLADPRVVVSADAAVRWAELLSNVSLPEALAGLDEYQRTTTDWLHPAAIADVVRRQRARGPERDARVQAQLARATAERALEPVPPCPKHPEHTIANCRTCFPSRRVGRLTA